MKEKPKRLPPTRNTLRELYLKSGNRCSFSGCNKVLFNAKGVFVAQICHIEAAEPGGERFNADQTNEQRRHASNLTLMCYDHHVETNNVEQFPTAKMKRFKAEHEKKFSDVVGSMLETISDQTDFADVVLAENLKKLNRTLEWKHSKAELEYVIKDVNGVAKRIKKIPLSARELFLVIVKRGEECRVPLTIEISDAEVRLATGQSVQTIRELISVLDSHGFVFDNGINDFGVPMVGVSQLEYSWSIWNDLKYFCEVEKIDIAEIIIGLDFSVLDD